MFKQGQINSYLENIIKQDVSQHERLLNDLQQRTPHSINIISSEQYEGLKISEFMCFEFAFNMLPSNVNLYKGVLEYNKKWKKITPVGVDKMFFLYLIRNNKIEEIYIEDVKDDDLIIYYHHGQPTHAGKMIKRRVKSKWGVGFLLEHEIHEVPEKYGNIVKFFRSISLENCIELFIDYAKERGIPFQKINDL